MTDGAEMFHRAAGRSFKGFSAEEEGEWKGPFYFVQAADPQLGLMKAWAIGDTDNGGDEWEQEVLLTEKAIQAVNRLTPLPRFMAICGDLIHAMPGTQWREAQERDLKTVLQKVNPAIPLVFVSGNHDLGNTPNAQTVTDYCCSWGDDYFSFWVGGVLFLVLNSQLFFDSSACPELQQAHDAWLSQQLDEASKRKCRHVIVFQHIPLFVNSFEEEHDYFNLKRPVRQELLGKFRKAGVKAVFSGHCHRNAGGVHDGVDMVVTSAVGQQLGDDTHGLRIVLVTEEKVAHQYYSLDELLDGGMGSEMRELLGATLS